MDTSIQFVGPAYYFDNKAVAIQESINYYLEIAGQEGRQMMSLRGSPGLQDYVTGLNGAIRGLWEFDGLPYTVAGTSFYTISNTPTATSKGTIPGTQRLYAAFNTNNQIVICDSPIGFMDGYFIFPGSVTVGYVYNISTGLVASISDTDFDTAGERAFFISAINDGTDYDALDFASPESDPDKVVAVVCDHRLAMMFGTKTIEFWINTGAVDFPFVRQTGAIVQRGTCAKGSVVQGDNVVFFLGDDRVFYMLQGFTAIPISPAPVTEAIESYGDVSDCECFYHVWRGHKFLTCNFPTGGPNGLGETWVYDASLPPDIGWHKRKSWKIDRWLGNSHCYAYGKHLVGSYLDGTISEMRADVYKEGDNPLEAIRIGHYMHADNKRITLPKFELLMQSGVGLLSGQGSAPKIALQHSTDAGNTFKNERWKDIGYLGSHIQRVMWRNVATNEGPISLKTTITDPVRRDIVGAVGDVKVGR